MSNNNPYFQHHFVDSEQQYEASKFGMWAFLVTEVLTFAGFFCAYAIFRAWNPEMFINAHKALDVVMGGTNTVVLITSSLTMALAIRYIQLNNRKAAIINLVLTLLFAGVFLVIKYFEYEHKFHCGHLPGSYYSPLAAPDCMAIQGDNPHVFFSIYFMMTGLHGIHVVIGMGLILWLILRTRKGHFSPAYYTPIEIVGLFWHLVDLIWIFLFPLLYLIG
tara:strand:+ start:1197 stop:1853 length:657 start_codon:yes stop_codon:yes gene_type:complete